MIEFGPGLSLAGVSNFYIFKGRGDLCAFHSRILGISEGYWRWLERFAIQKSYPWLDDIVHSGCKHTTYSGQRNAAVN